MHEKRCSPMGQISRNGLTSDKFPVSCYGGSNICDVAVVTVTVVTVKLHITYNLLKIRDIIVGNSKEPKCQIVIIKKYFAYGSFHQVGP